MRFQRSCTARYWRGSVVRMKSSLEISSSCHRSLKRGACESHHSCGVMPWSAAASATFSPCSSMPVRNLTSYPLERR